MTLPRRHLPNEVVMLDRRTQRREYLLAPSDTTNAIVAYETARAAERHGQDVHAAVAMSNHVHFVVTDTTACRSDFMRDAMCGCSHAINHSLGRDGSLWDNRSFGETLLLDLNAIERKIVYTCLNPVAAGVVDSLEDYEGFIILPRHWGTTIRVPRPDVYYGPNSPEYIEFTPQPPPEHGDRPLEERIAHYENLIEEARLQLLAARSSFGDKPSSDAVTHNPGSEGLSAEDDTSSTGDDMHNTENEKPHAGHAMPSTDEQEPEPVSLPRPSPVKSPSTPSGYGQRRPRFASSDPQLLEAAEAQYRDFLDLYRRQRKRWLSGAKPKRCVFPAGTVWLRKNSPVRCAPPPAISIGMIPRREPGSQSAAA